MRANEVWAHSLETSTKLGRADGTRCAPLWFRSGVATHDRRVLLSRTAHHRILAQQIAGCRGRCGDDVHPGDRNSAPARPLVVVRPGGGWRRHDGLQQGSEIDLIAYFISRGFGSTHYGAIYGAVAIGGALSTAAALVFFGRVHDVTGSYDVALNVGAVAFCIGAAAFAVIGRLRPQASAD
jgi:hypothetical protein